jgi:hypothetical protein
MMIGMVPMALGLGEGGEQNAPLGRAVIGGLLLATVATLFFVPTFFTVLHSLRRRTAIPEPEHLDAVVSGCGATLTATCRSGFCSIGIKPPPYPCSYTDLHTCSCTSRMHIRCVITI